MSATGKVAASAVLAAMLAIVAVTSSSVLDPRPGPGRPLMALDGEGLDATSDEPLHLSDLHGPAPQEAYGATAGDPYMVLKLEGAVVEQARTAGFDLPPLTPHPHEDALLVAYSAKSTFLGCQVQLMPSLPGPGLWLVDACHQGQFNVLDNGEPRPGTPNGGRLPSAEVVLGDGSDPVLFIR